MGTIVITTYGHKETIDKIAFSSFVNEWDENTYCDTINALELKGDAWVFAKVFSENIQYTLEAFLPVKFSDIITRLDDRAIQRILRESDSQDFAKALKSETETVKEKIFSNMTERATEMLKEDIEYLGPIRKKDARESQEKILDIIHLLSQTGEIVLPPYKGEITEGGTTK
jgi:flagellar motor switch protein FliG